MTVEDKIEENLSNIIFQEESSFIINDKLCSFKKK